MARQTSGHDSHVEAVRRVGRFRGRLSITSENDAYTVVFVEDRHHAATVNLVFLEDPHAKMFHLAPSVATDCGVYASKRRGIAGCDSCHKSCEDAQRAHMAIREGGELPSPTDH